jgi:hypothetical protein
VKPSRYDDDGQNFGYENVGVELDGVWHDAGVYRRWDWIATRRRREHRICSALKFIPLGAKFATIIGNRLASWKVMGKRGSNWARVSHFQHQPIWVEKIERIIMRSPHER